MQKSYRIAGITFKITSERDYYELQALKPFACGETGVADDVVQYQVCSLLTTQFPSEDCLIGGNRFFRVYDVGDYRFRMWDIHENGEELHTFLKWKKGQNNNYEIQTPPTPNFDLGRYLLPWEYFNLGSVLLERSAFLLHASLIRFQGNGILFSAPSGTGKSTQADLWVKYRGADILNGDRAIIRKQQNGYWAYGSPMAGTSGIYRNEGVPVRAIIILDQGPRNIIQQMAPGESFRRIYQQTQLDPWDKEFMEKATELIANVVEDIPIYHLSCRPDEGAVALVEQTLFGQREGAQ